MATLLPKIIGFLINILSFFSAKKAAKLALKLFSTPRQGRYTDKHKGFTAAVNINYLHYNELKIATYHFKGKGDTVLLVHGWESNASRWKKLITQLQLKGYNIIALDAPAHGCSDSKIFNAILYSEFINIVAKKFKPKFVIGHSVGGMASVFFQKKYQLNCIKKLILLGAPANFTDVNQRYINMMGYNKRVATALNQVIIDVFKNHPNHYSTAKFIKHIHQPVLIIHDKNDKIIPYDDAKLIEKNALNSHLITTKGLGHSLNSPDIINHILNFMSCD